MLMKVSLVSLVLTNVLIINVVVAIKNIQKGFDVQGDKKSSGSGRLS